MGEICDMCGREVGPLIHIRGQCSPSEEKASKKTYQFEELNLITGPLVYIWYRLGQAMYVGYSRVGLIRPLGINHPTLPHAWTPVDTLEVHYFSTGAEASRYEADLLAKLDPKLNKIKVTI